MDELVAAVSDLLAHPAKLALLRERVRARRRPDAARRIALWLERAVEDSDARGIV
jgi:UDP-N-acetylglucosamine:LPS N-acetylglucosamine transferase